MLLLNVFIVTWLCEVSDTGQVWGWGYGGEGQLGLGSRIRMVSSPHPIPCIVSSSVGKDRREGQGYRAPGSYIKGIACGGRHSAVVTGKVSKRLLIQYFQLHYL